MWSYFHNAFITPHLSPPSPRGHGPRSTRTRSCTKTQLQSRANPESKIQGSISRCRNESIGQGVSQVPDASPSRIGRCNECCSSRSCWGCYRKGKGQGQGQREGDKIIWTSKGIWNWCSQLEINWRCYCCQRQRHRHCDSNSRVRRCGISLPSQHRRPDHEHGFRLRVFRSLGFQHAISCLFANRSHQLRPVKVHHFQTPARLYLLHLLR